MNNLLSLLLMLLPARVVRCMQCLPDLGNAPQRRLQRLRMTSQRLAVLHQHLATQQIEALYSMRAPRESASSASRAKNA